MSELTDDRLREIEAWAELVSTFPPAEGHPPPKDYAEIAAICTELLALRAAASTSTEGAGVIEALRTLTSAVENMRVPQNIAEAAMQVELTIGPALRSAQDVLRALTPPAPKVTTQERNA